MDVAVEEVVADVGGGSLHALDEDFSFGHVEVVVEELTRVFGLPEEIFGDVSPELCRTKRGIREARVARMSFCFDPWSASKLTGNYLMLQIAA